MAVIGHRKNARLPSSTWVSIMAALLRFSAARACRLLASYSSRNPSIYQKHSSAFYREHILKACQPILSGSRYLSNETSTSEEVPGEAFENQTEGGSAATEVDSGRDVREKPRSMQGGDFKYQRQVRQLGTLVMKPVLVRTYKEILERGKLHVDFEQV